ncbi:hypothetical protein G6O69_19940 [Pseudenhygromyxa sp. WMMC2535]|uniref:hypothetical protein n=1 Tax=Pseudenhygromyxa sp. WMMC2535 TaxID=2712867 RepID=UPI0015531E89|nr:hypothetical protein [Pseudenhygromyxa sp. WMMC2535]NVB40128.1 hypothetical protein [Pseudenhygromyxa sp. WMMC2535]
MSTASTTWIEHALAPLDRLRARTLRATMPVSSHFAARREPRVALIGALSVLAALIGVASFPLWMLALGPIVLGVPHLLADLRYCVVRPGWHRRPALWLGVGLPLVAVAVGADMAVGFAAVAGACVGLDGPRWRRLVGVLAAAIAAGVCMVAGPRSTLVLLHLHNAVALALWWRWREHEGGLRRWPALAVLGGCALILAGGLDAAFVEHAPARLDLAHHLQALAPGFSGAAALRLVLLFAFAQSVHYAIWLRLVPEDDRERATPRSFRASWRALVAELGPLAWVALAAAMGLAAWALVDLAQARAGYLRLARFHLFLELALLASLWTRGRARVLPHCRDQLARIEEPVVKPSTGS